MCIAVALPSSDFVGEGMFVGNAAVEALDRDPSMPSPVRFRTHDEHQGEIQVYLTSLLFRDYSVDRGRGAAERLLQVRDGIAALIAANDVTAVGAIEVSSREGFQMHGTFRSSFSMMSRQFICSIRH
jgi:hypothetical protein